MKTLTQSGLCVIVMADNRTAELCFENMDVLDILRQPIKAEKKWEWEAKSTIIKKEKEMLTCT